MQKYAMDTDRRQRSTLYVSLT